jgi:hypothetical protein
MTNGWILKCIDCVRRPPSSDGQEHARAGQVRQGFLRDARLATAVVERASMSTGVSTGVRAWMLGAPTASFGGGRHPMGCFWESPSTKARRVRRNAASLSAADKTVMHSSGTSSPPCSRAWRAAFRLSKPTSMHGPCRNMKHQWVSKPTYIFDATMQPQQRKFVRKKSPRDGGYQHVQLPSWTWSAC